MRILSIDFDYFVDTDVITRFLYFPDGNDNLSDYLTHFIWDKCYESDNSLKDIGVIEDFNIICDFLSTQTPKKLLVADSHREIVKFFNDIKKDEELELINIDFHHDMFITGGDTLDCGNWLRFLVDLKPDAKITWIRREDSSTDSLLGEFPYHNSTDISEVQGKFDLIFICFSSPWTPPHLKPYFDEMCQCIERLE